MIKAIADRIFIRLDPLQKGGIIIDDYHTARNTGVVVSIGERVSRVKEGQHVIFHIFDDLPTCEKDVVAVRENSILGVISND